MPDLFEVLKRPRHQAEPRSMMRLEHFHFRVRMDAEGGWLDLCDNNGTALPEYSHEWASGAVRELLKSMRAIQERESGQFSWVPGPGGISLAAHEHLLELLAQCPDVVDGELKPLGFAAEPGELVVRLLPLPAAAPGAGAATAPARLDAQVRLRLAGAESAAPQVPAEGWACAGNQLCRIAPLGVNFTRLPLFATEILESEAERYLSLLYSTFENITVEFRNLRVVTGEPMAARPALIMERVDEDGNLYLRVAETLPGFSPEFLEEYDILRIATVNELEQVLSVSPVQHESTAACHAAIEKRLKPRTRQDEGMWMAKADGVFILSDRLAHAFLTQDLAYFLGSYPVFGVEQLGRHKVRTPTPKLRGSFSFGVDFLEGDAQLEIEGQLFDLGEALAMLQKNPFIPLNDGSFAVINREYIQRLSRLFKKQKQGVRLSFFDLPLADDLLAEAAEAQGALRQAREVFAGFNTLAERPLPQLKLKATLRPYQEHGWRWLQYLHEHRLGGCLADDMGLGKTVQALALLTTLYPAQKKPTLIVMPRSLLFNWAGEIGKFCPQLRFAVYHGDERDLAAARKQQVILTTYAVLRIDIQALLEQEFHCVILDESQNIKNLNSQVSKAARLLKAEHRLALSGTPLENHLGELYALFRFLNPSMFDSLEQFNEDYATPIQKENDHAATQELRRKIYPFILRRLKRDVATELPEKTEQTLFVDMAPDQARLYAERRRYYHETVQAQVALNGIDKSQFVILQAFTELRQLASIPEALTDGAITSPKLELLQEQLEDVLAGGHKVLVFANFLAAVEAVSAGLTAAGVQHVTMTGATRDRETRVRQFQEDPACKAFVCTLKTGGVGLNLTAADYVFLFDPWWNRAAENQAVDRTHRIGQDKSVFSYRLITRGTIEEKILLLQEKKNALFDSLIAADGASLKRLSAEDIDFVLGGE